MSNEFGRGVELVATRSTLRRNELAPPPPPPPPPSFRDGDREMNKDREDGADKSTTTASLGRSGVANDDEEGLELELHRLSSIEGIRRYHRRLKSSSSSPFVKQQRMSNPRGRTQSLLVLLSPSMDATPRGSMTAAAAKATLRLSADHTNRWPVDNDVKSNDDISSFTTNINNDMLLLEGEKAMQIKKSSEEFEAVYRPKEKKSFEAFDATYRSKVQQRRPGSTQTLQSNPAKKEKSSSPKKEGQHLMEEDTINGAVAYLKKVKNDRIESLGKVSYPTRDEGVGACDVGVRASLKKDVKEGMHANSDDTVQGYLSSISLPSLVRARGMSPLPSSIANSTRLGDDDYAVVDESPTTTTTTTTDLIPSRPHDRYPSSNKAQYRGNEDVRSTGSPTDVERFPSSDFFCHVHDAVDNAVDRIDDAIHGCIGDAFPCGNDSELHYHHRIYASRPDVDDNEEMRLRDRRRNKKHMMRRTTRRYGSSSGRVRRGKVRFGHDTILSEGTMIKEDSFYNVLQLPLDDFDQ